VGLKSGGDVRGCSGHRNGLKAIVCVFYTAVMITAIPPVPYDTSSYNAYSALRPTLAYARDALTATALARSTIRKTAQVSAINMRWHRIWHR
jgi:hypothetical protein